MPSFLHSNREVSFPEWVNSGFVDNKLEVARPTLSAAFGSIDNAQGLGRSGLITGLDESLIFVVQRSVLI